MGRGDELRNDRAGLENFRVSSRDGGLTISAGTGVPEHRLFRCICGIVERGGADALDLATRQGGLRSWRHRWPFRPPRRPGVQLVDEQMVFLAGNSFMTALMRSRIDPYLVPATIMANRVRQCVCRGAVPGRCYRRYLCQTFDNGSLAPPGLAQQDGVILGAG